MSRGLRTSQPAPLIRFFARRRICEYAVSWIDLPAFAGLTEQGHACYLWRARQRRSSRRQMENNTCGTRRPMGLMCEIDRRSARRVRSATSAWRLREGARASVAAGAAGHAGGQV